MDDPPAIPSVKLASTLVPTPTATEEIGAHQLSPPLNPPPTLPPAEPPPLGYTFNKLTMITNPKDPPPSVDIPLTHWWQDFHYNILLPKLRRCQVPPFPHGSIVDVEHPPHPNSPMMPFDFLFVNVVEKYYDGGLVDLVDQQSPMDSVTRGLLEHPKYVV
jgi:hypothetical protein